MKQVGYYYLKLKENFFDGDEIKILESMENGYLYSNILLKLYLKALKNDGKLIFNEYIPYNIKMLSTITGHNVDIVEKSLNIFKSMHLIDVLDNGTIYMLDIQKMIGSISSEGIRKAEYRERINLEKEKQLKLNSGTLSQKCPDIISNSNYNSNYNSLSLSDTKNIDYNIDKSIDLEEKKEKEKKEEKHKYGKHNNVLLTEKEYNKILARENGAEVLDFFSDRLEAKKYKYSSHYRAMLNWAFESYEEKQVRAEELQQRKEKLKNNKQNKTKNKTFTEELEEQNAIIMEALKDF